MSKPVCVITGDIHFTPSMLELASASVMKAKHHAIELGVPLVLNGDVLDGKAIIRAECSNRLIEIIDDPRLHIYVNTGNHDLINEKSKESSLNFLWPFATVIREPEYIKCLESWVVPYFSDPTELSTWLLSVPKKGDRLIMHQGVQTAFLGHYVQDKTSLPPEAFQDFRVIASHYHRAQDIKCSRPRIDAVGLFSYVGSPYTTSFAEANDGSKGFQVLYDNGSLELIPTNLRKHVIFEVEYSKEYMQSDFNVSPGDIVWLKIRGLHSELDSLKAHDFRDMFSEASSFKLDKIYTDSVKIEKSLDKLTEADILDTMIEGTSESVDQKDALKKLWREIL